MLGALDVSTLPAPKLNPSVQVLQFLKVVSLVALVTGILRPIKAPFGPENVNVPPAPRAKIKDSADARAPVATITKMQIARTRFINVLPFLSPPLKRFNYAHVVYTNNQRTTIFFFATLVYDSVLQRLRNQLVAKFHSV